MKNLYMVIQFLLVAIASFSLAGCASPAPAAVNPTPPPAPTVMPYGSGRLATTDAVDGVFVTLNLSIEDPETYAQTYFTIHTAKEPFYVLPNVQTFERGFSSSDLVNAQIGVYQPNLGKELMCPGQPSNFSCPISMKPWPKK